MLFETLWVAFRCTHFEAKIEKLSSLFPPLKSLSGHGFCSRIFGSEPARKVASSWTNFGFFFALILLIIWHSPHIGVRVYGSECRVWYSANTIRTCITHTTHTDDMGRVHTHTEYIIFSIVSLYSVGVNPSCTRHLIKKIKLEQGGLMIILNFNLPGLHRLL